MFLFDQVSIYQYTNLQLYYQSGSLLVSIQENYNSLKKQLNTCNSKNFSPTNHTYSFAVQLLSLLDSSIICQLKNQVQQSMSNCTGIAPFVKRRIAPLTKMPAHCWCRRFMQVQELFRVGETLVAAALASTTLSHAARLYAHV